MAERLVGLGFSWNKGEQQRCFIPAALLGPISAWNPEHGQHASQILCNDDVIM